MGTEGPPRTSINGGNDDVCSLVLFVLPSFSVSIDNRNRLIFFLEFRSYRCVGTELNSNRWNHGL